MKKGIINGDCCIGQELENYFSNCSGSVFLFSPFISINTLEKVLRTYKGSGVSIITSWKIEHLVAGVSSLELYEYCKKRRYSLYINSRLHAKIYSDSFNSAYIGSMNCTDAALYNEEGNIECYRFLDKMSVGDRIELNTVINKSVLVNDEIYRKYKDILDEIPDVNPPEVSEPNLEDVSPFYILQLPACENPEMLWTYISDPEPESEYASQIEHDLSIYIKNPFSYSDKADFMHDLAQGFINHPFVREIEKIVSPTGTRFGQFKEFVQNNCMDVPAPYRKDLTKPVQNIYTWFSTLLPERYYVIRPHVSELLCRR